MKESDNRKKLAMEYLDIINEIPRGAIRTAHLGMLRERFPELKQGDNGDDDEANGVIRFDLKFPTTVVGGKNREFWIDHAIVQETCPTHAADTLKFLESADSNQPDQSPAFVKTYKSKQRRYGALIDVVNRLTDERRLKSAPTFLFPIVSSLGYVNQDMVTLIKSISKCFKVNQSDARRNDGIDLGKLRGRFKTEVRNSLCFALARGNAMSICNQGLNGITHPC